MATKLSVNALQQAIGTNSVVEFFAPWCGHCKTLAPVYDQVAQSIKQRNPGIHVGKFDYHKHGKEVAAMNIGVNEFGKPISEAVRGFPTIMLFGKGGRTAMYNGPRSASEMTEAFLNFYAKDGSSMLSGGGCEKCNKEGCNCGPDCGCGEGECDCGEGLGGGGKVVRFAQPPTLAEITSRVLTLEKRMQTMGRNF